MVFTSLGQMYRLLVNDIPEGNNTTKGAPLGTLISFENNEQIMAVTSLYRNTDAKYVMFITKNGIIKKTSLEEYDKTRKKNGVKAITLREGDSLASVTFLNQEDIIILSKQGMSIRIDSNTIGASSRIAQGVIGINLKENDEVLTLLPIHKDTDKLAIFTKQGLGKQTILSEFPKQQRAGRGVGCIKFANDNDELAGGLMLEDNDLVLVCGRTKSLCIASSDISTQGRSTIGNKIITDNTIVSVSKV
jgi:DNA gyrase subunit A